MRPVALDSAGTREPRRAGGILLVAHDLSRPDIGGRNRVIAGVRRILTPAAAAVVGLAARVRGRNGDVAVVANDYVAGTLRRWVPQASIVPYETRLLRQVEEADYARLHRFADLLEQISRRAAAAGGGFTHKGLSLIKIHEIRWIWHVAYAEGSLSLFEQELRARGWHRLAALGFSAQLPYAVRALRRVGGTRSRSARAMAHIAETREYDGHSRFLRRMFPHFLERVTEGSRPPAVPAKGGARRLLAVGNFDRTIERLEHLLPTLSLAGFEIHLLALPRLKSIERLAAAGVRCSLVGDWLTPTEVTALKPAAAAKSERWWAELTAAMRETTVDHESRELFDNVRPLLEAHFRYGAEPTMMAAEVGRRAVEAIQPDIVLNFEDWEFNRAVTVVAAESGVASVAYYCLSAPGVAGLVRRTQPWMAVAGENLRAAFRSQYGEDRIRVVGDPLAQPAKSLPDAAQRQAYREALNLASDRPLIVILSSFPVSGISLLDIETVFRRTFAAARAIDAQVVVKSHPAQSVAQIRGWMKAWDCGNAPILYDVSLFDLCACADLVSVPVTSAVHQAMMAGTPVVCLQTRESLEPFESMGFSYLAGKGIVHAPPGTDLETMFRSLIFDRTRRAEQIRRGFAHVEEHSGPLDGRAPERFLAFVEDILHARGATCRTA